MLRAPYERELEGAERVLLIGAGGEFDVYCALPLYFALRAAGKSVTPAGVSSSELPRRSGRWVTPDLLEVTAEIEHREGYFPELWLARWLKEHDEQASVYAARLTGIAPLQASYAALAAEVNADAVVLVDGGTDSLLRGDEPGLGSPVEDISNLLAVHGLPMPRKLLTCLGFGVPADQQLCHSYVLETIAELTASGDFLGATCWTTGMPEVARFAAAAREGLAQVKRGPNPSLAGLIAALDGQFGLDVGPKTAPTPPRLISPLATICWSFRLDAVAERLLYPAALAQTQTAMETDTLLTRFRGTHPNIKSWRPLPL